jgi:hypothetical protein
MRAERGRIADQQIGRNMWFRSQARVVARNPISPLPYVCPHSIVRGAASAMLAVPIWLFVTACAVSYASCQTIKVRRDLLPHIAKIVHDRPPAPL